MYYYKTNKWFAPVDSVSYIKIADNFLAVFFKNGQWEYITGKKLELLNETGKVVNTYDDCDSENKEIIQNRFEAIITDFIQINKPVKNY